ncbi:MAG TPA: response regulator [Candidatus Omnitrophota bacterium]|nr:response regulator [Candidatus Omnitrophota bacterium]
MAKILVADDEEDVGVLISERLQSEGHDVEWVSDGTMAIARLEAEQFDLAILDIRMGGCGGYGVCSVAKNSPRCRHIPVILMSAIEKDSLDWKRVKADAFMLKPFETERLVGLVRECLRKGQTGG